MGRHRLRERSVTNLRAGTKSIFQSICSWWPSISDFDDPLADQLVDQLSWGPDRLVDENLVGLVNLLGPRLARRRFTVARLGGGGLPTP
jgi:hypothetical protein